MSGERLLRLVVRKGVDVTGGVSAGTAYSFESACPTCGTGASQIGPLHLPRFKVPKADLFSTLDSEIIVTPKLAEHLRAADVRSLGPVVGTDGHPLPFEQLLPQATLPRFGEETTGFVRERPCPVCGRDGYFGVPNVPLRLVYPSLPAELLDKDVLATFERFGNSRLRTPLRDSVFAAPVYVIGGRVADALRAAGVRSAEVEPVRLEASATPEAGTASAASRAAR
ncbi:MAG TPA: hypothetical protein VIK51_00605 [Vicinamibacteria bacterium]